MPNLELKKVSVHNLKKVNLTLRPRELIVFTGVSGSGKSSLAFHTIYVEGQRRYIESLSTFARRHLGDFKRPEAESIVGISPTVAIEQKTAGNNPRSTVGTMTGIYDFLRVLFARVSTAYCPESLEIVEPQSAETIFFTIKEKAKGQKAIILAPYAKQKKGEFVQDFAHLLRQGFTRIRLDGRMVELPSDIQIDKTVPHDIDLIIDRLILNEDNISRLKESIKMALELGNGLMSVLFNEEKGEELFFSMHAYAKGSNRSYPPLEPSHFSFNHPLGMCPHCQGLGDILEFDITKIIDPKKSIQEDCCSIGSSYTTVRFGNIYRNLARLYHFRVDTPWKDLSEEAKKIFLYGNDRKWTPMEFEHPTKGSSWTEYVSWKGVLSEAKTRFQEAKSELYRSKMEELMHKMQCPVCLGSRLKPYPSAARIGGKTIPEITALSIHEAKQFFTSLLFDKIKKQIAEELCKEISQRLFFLDEVGLHYLTLDRTAPTLSGGEAQRVRLAEQIGTSLVGATYILDEPSIGLHPRDNSRLIATLKTLRDLGNTVIVVEHDEEMIKAADYIVDVGPFAGAHGGTIVAQGTLSAIIDAKESLTGAYLSGRKQIPYSKKRKKPEQFLEIQKASHHNLKNIDVKIPLHLFVAITGVSGSGKSSLISDTLYPALANHLHGSSLQVGAHKAIIGIEAIDKVIAIDQTPIGRTPRSNPATYVQLFDEIRELFSSLPESAAIGFSKSRFSFNLKDGACPHCSGMGRLKMDMDFLEDAFVECVHCQGKQFDEKTLSIRYKGKNIHDILSMTIEEAAVFFQAIPKIAKKIDCLIQIGLGYLRLGQSSPTLSGGEAQRIKLAKELSRPSTQKTVYILDEPTTGLHFDDIHKLLHVLDQLIVKGGSVLVIEHNMDLVKRADWVIDLGPEGGSLGGKIIAEGTPETVSKSKSITAPFLHAALHPHFTIHQEHSPKAIQENNLHVSGAEQNNLKNISATIPQRQITICTGPSGSGKSSFAFETLYAEGQRRYIESMSPYARQFVKMPMKPKVGKIDGLSPAIAIEQKHHAGNPRSTVGTITEVYDYLRILYAHLGVAHCPETKEILQTITVPFVVDKLLELEEGTKVHILTPLLIKRKETVQEITAKWVSLGFLRIRLNDRYFEMHEEIPFDPTKKNTLFLVVDRLVISPSSRKRLLEAVEMATRLSSGQMVAAIEKKATTSDLFFNLSFAAPSTGKSYPLLTPHSFSFNTQEGMCPSCLGIGVQWGADLSEQKELYTLTPIYLLQLLWDTYAHKELINSTIKLLKKLKIDPHTPLSEQNLKAQMTFLEGDEKVEIEVDGVWIRWRGFSIAFELAINLINKESKELLKPFLKEKTCLECNGTRLSRLARLVEIDGVTLPDLCAMSLEKASSFISALLPRTANNPLFEEPMRGLQSRLELLLKMGVEYLSLDRRAPTLSSGEMQRLRLARQLGSQLTGCLYVLDEPTVGLHPHNNAIVNKALIDLKNLGNTLLLVEHDPQTIALADYVLDFGKGAGKYGGEIIARGSLEEIKCNPLSLTGAYLTGKKQIPQREKRRKSSSFIRIKNASLHHLKKISVAFPVQAITSITGVSGAGKSTLMSDLLYPAAKLALSKKVDALTYLGMSCEGFSSFTDVLSLDQNPIGQTNRADITTYVDLLTPLRQLFASLPLAIASGLEPKHFSFNHKKGMCTTCQGHGYRTIDLQFLAPVTIECEACRGNRLCQMSLEVKFKGKHLGEIFRLTPQEALSFLPPHRKMVRILQTLIDVGLGYIQLGQEVATLSGGEAQRLRMVREIARVSKGKTLYLFDEPTVGLHSEDIAVLLNVFQKLVDKGHTVIAIEHNLDFIAASDYVIDLGPDAGVHGGEVVAKGTPEEICKIDKSHTGKYLKTTLKDFV